LAGVGRFPVILYSSNKISARIPPIGNSFLGSILAKVLVEVVKNPMI